MGTTCRGARSATNNLPIGTMYKRAKSGSKLLQEELDKGQYQRRVGDDGSRAMPPPDYVYERWVLINRFGEPVKMLEGQPVRNWIRRRLHGTLWVRCVIDDDGNAILPGRLK